MLQPLPESLLGRGTRDLVSRQPHAPLKLEDRQGRDGVQLRPLALHVVPELCQPPPDGVQLIPPFPVLDQLLEVRTGVRLAHDRVVLRPLLLPQALALDERASWLVTLVGIPSAFLLHGYVGFIFGSVKANPWWSTPLMPIVFLFSAIVSGIATVMLLYMLLTWLRDVPTDMRCLDTIARYLLYSFIIDFSLEMLDRFPGDDALSDFDERLARQRPSVPVLVRLAAKLARSGSS